MNLNLSFLRGWATDEGFTGDPTPDAVRAFLIAKNATLTDEATGKPVDLATATIVDDTPKAKPAARTLPRAAAALVAAATVGSAAPDDLDAKIKAATDQAVRAAIGSTPSGRPNLAAGTTVEVKSVAEELYERKIAQKQASFRSYANARAFALSMLAKGARKESPEQAAAYRKQHDEFCERAGIQFRAMSTTSATGGQALVDPAYNLDLIWNVKEYGVAPKLLKNVQANTDTVTRKRRTGGLTVYYPNQNAAITESNPTYDTIELRSKDAMTLTQMSMQFVGDSAINEMDEVAKEIVVALSKAIDDATFIGDGTATYANITGYCNKFGSASTDGGYVVSTDGVTTAAAHTLAGAYAVLGRLPSYARTNPVWVCSPEFAALIFARLSGAVGGMQFKDVQGFGYVQMFLGRPVIEVNSMPSTNAAAAGVDVLFGDFSKSGTFFDRMDIQIDVDDSIYFPNYARAVRGVVRYDVNIHDVGSASVAGPVVSWWQLT